MSKPQPKDSAAALLGLMGAVTATLAPVLVEEIARAREYLGLRLGDAQREELLKEPFPQLIQEAQVIGAAVELRQKCEIAQKVRESLTAASPTEYTLKS